MSEIKKEWLHTPQNATLFKTAETEEEEEETSGGKRLSKVVEINQQVSVQRNGAGRFRY